MKNHKHTKIRKNNRRGVSLVEMLISLAISALLLTATMVAIDASFIAYATSAEMASTNAAARMVGNRVTTLIRTTTAHGPLLPDEDADVTIDGNTITSPYIELQQPNGQFIRIEYREDDQELWLVQDPFSESPTQQPIIGGITQCSFKLVRRLNYSKIWVLSRGTMDLTIEPGSDSNLSIEAKARVAPVRVIASTAPRKIDE